MLKGSELDRDKRKQSNKSNNSKRDADREFMRRKAVEKIVSNINRGLDTKEMLDLLGCLNYAFYTYCCFFKYNTIPRKLRAKWDIALQ
jgi:hypothetical protein